MPGHLSAVALGLLTWTFLEYGLHHWVGHLGRGRPEASREHLKHHATPDYFSPPIKKLALAVPVLSVLSVIAALPTTWITGLLYGGAVGAGWLGYEVAHRRIHVAGPTHAYGRWMRRHHLHHHFNPRMNHGVTSPLWDLVFRTWERPGVVQIPRRHAHRLPWLLVPGEGAGRDVRSELAQDYRVV